MRRGPVHCRKCGFFTPQQKRVNFDSALEFDCEECYDRFEPVVVSYLLPTSPARFSVIERWTRKLLSDRPMRLEDAKRLAERLRD